MGKQAEELGVDIFPGTPAAEILYGDSERSHVVGASCTSRVISVNFGSISIDTWGIVTMITWQLVIHNVTVLTCTCVTDHTIYSAHPSLCYGPHNVINSAQPSL